MSPAIFSPRTRAHEESLAAGLDAARLDYWEQPGRAMATAIRAQERARVLGADCLRGRAIVAQASVCMHRGDLRGAFALVAEAEPFATDDACRIEIAALHAQLHYFSGSYGEALRQAERAVALADASGDLALRLHARRMGCVAFGNIGVDDMDARLEETLALALEAKSPWEEAIVRNDLACFALTTGGTDEAARQLERAHEIALGIGPYNRFLLAVVHCTRSELRLLTGAPADAVRDATRAVGFLVATDDDVNPYLLGMSVLMLVRSLLKAGRVEDARKAARSSLERSGRPRPPGAQLDPRVGGGGAAHRRSHRGGLRGAHPQRRARARGSRGVLPAAARPRTRASAGCHRTTPGRRARRTQPAAGDRRRSPARRGRPRRADRPAQPSLPRPRQPVRPGRSAGEPRHCRHRPLQGDQRPLRASRRRPGPDPHRRALRRPHARRGRRRADRRRGVRAVHARSRTARGRGLLRAAARRRRP